MDAAHFKEIYRIESTRLNGWDYGASGWYFLTICTDQKRFYFEDSRIKTVAEKYWQEISKHFPVAFLGDFVVMPNHLHGAIKIKDHPVLSVETPHVASLPLVTRTSSACPKLTSRIDKQSNQTNDYYKLISAKSHQHIPNIIQAFKAAVTKYCHENQLNFAWQPRYYDYIVRDEKQLFWIEQYIRENPQNWEKDPNFIKGA